MEFSIKDYIRNEKSTFEEVQDSYERVNNRSNSINDYGGTFTCLNYEKILNSIVDYLDGYLKYKDEDDDRFRGKIDDSTVAFYNKMFSDQKTYRMEIGLDDYRKVNRKFLELTKALQDKLDELDKCVDVEAERLKHITEKQYRKLAKTNSYDMKIYLWLKCGTSIPSEVKTAYNDKYTPVIHRK